MTWNEPGKNQNDNKDPWTGKSKPNNNTPPELDKLINDFIQKIGGVFGKRPSLPSTPSSHPPKQLIFFIMGALFILWLLSGLFIVGPASKGVILRFGKYTEMVNPGLHWSPRFIDRVIIINEEKIASYSYEALMLTKDENIVSVAIAVQYRISNARDYLFNVVNPQESLQQATASALRQVIGHTNLDDVLTSGREKIRQQVQVILREIMNTYHTGLLVTDVTIQPAKAPEEVKEAFDDAIKAQEDEQRIVNQAESYAMQVEPIAKGQAQRLLADAKAYKQQVVLRAQGETVRFTALLPQYQKSATLLKTRLYFDALETILAGHSKIFLDTQSNQMLYLPLDKLPQSFSVVPSVPNKNTTLKEIQAAASSQAGEAQQ